MSVNVTGNMSGTPKAARATPFTKLLVANRGEIAMRVLRSARAMGLHTVAVHSSADAGALHVRSADQAVAIGGPRPADSYLNIPAIIAAARATGAQAIHPGYGFLAENDDFAAACAEAGLVFVGPSAQAIRAMGHKAGAKRLMQAAGVPCIPGWQGEDQSEAHLLAQARQVGWPLMIKATAGGGGRGMRLVASEADFLAQLASARSEAQAAFGDDEVLLERAVIRPRHIEIQVLADRHGQAIHLGERDCSVQRRHQKVIEEAPSPAVDAGLRARMGAAAVAACHAIGYEGAGTLEFLLDERGEFFFMEMNTRLQVEHPVTEAITGLDLVALQLRIAMGEPLPLAQDDVRWQGHAIEVRLCAEDPAAGFMPQSGELALWQPATGIRVEHGLDAHSAIPPYYDSMVAKLIAHGDSRDQARQRLLHGLADTVALGVATNQAFLAACLAHPRFADGSATTAFIAEHGDALLTDDATARDEALVLAAAIGQLGAHSGAAGSAAPGASAGAPTGAPGASADANPLPHGFDLPLRLAVGNGPAVALRLRHGRAGQGMQVQLGETTHTVLPLQRQALPNSAAERLRILLDGVACEVVALRTARDAQGAHTLLLHRLGHAGARPWRIVDHTLEPVLRHRAGASNGQVRAAMNGRVVSVAAQVGDVLAAGQAILSLEAMKMQHVHAAPVAGVLKALHVALGDQVAADRVVAEVEPAAAPATAAPVEEKPDV